MLVLRANALLCLLALISFAAAAKPTSFCKCTCFTNSTIIPLDAHLNEPSLKRSLFLRQPDSEDDVTEPISDSPSDSDGKKKEPDEGEKKDKGGGNDDDGDKKEYRAGTCNDCTRQFCLDYNLPICKKASLEDVFTTCFQRDSSKDEAVVFIFIIATVGLLVWAAVKPWVNQWVNAARERSSYIPVSSGDN